MGRKGPDGECADEREPKMPRTSEQVAGERPTLRDVPEAELKGLLPKPASRPK